LNNKLLPSVKILRKQYGEVSVEACGHTVCIFRGNRPYVFDGFKIKKKNDVENAVAGS
jgi:hypothetical protein